MILYVSDSFHLSVLDRSAQHEPQRQSGSWHRTLVVGTRIPVPITLEQAKNLVRLSKTVVSAIEGAVPAIIISNLLEKDLDQNKIIFKLSKFDALIIAVPKDCNTFSKEWVDTIPGSDIEWWLVG